MIMKYDSTDGASTAVLETGKGTALSRFLPWIVEEEPRRVPQRSLTQA